MIQNVVQSLATITSLFSGNLRSVGCLYFVLPHAFEDNPGNRDWADRYQKQTTVKVDYIVNFCQWCWPWLLHNLIYWYNNCLKIKVLTDFHGVQFELVLYITYISTYICLYSYIHTWLYVCSYVASNDAAVYIITWLYVTS